MPYLTLDGTRLFYTADGDPNAPLALVLLHGAGGSHLIWPPAVRRLPGVRVLALDLPGHGRSSRPGRRRIEDYAAVVDAFVTALALPAAVLVGHSMGGAIAMAVALARPSWLRGLVVVGASARMRVGEALLGGTLTAFEPAADLVVDYGFITDVPTELRRRCRDALLETGPTTTFGDFFACNQFDIRSRLAALDLPVLVIGGDGDQLTPPRFMAALAEGLPNGEFTLVEGAGHFVMLERPGVVAALVAAFLASLKPGAS